ncbi:class I SAM-dependent methyltransferase [Novosphingobium sp.]|uniref:class I SAM-dependent methyltransferase n=1 Tax=Novosphingobium sp. TaxID=1874826 RepID=UPI0038B6FF1E
MGIAALWDRHVVPRLIGCACAAPPIMELRAQVVPLAHGDVFELGCGGGLNQQFYDPRRLASLAGIDPSPALLDTARARAAHLGHACDLRPGLGEAIPFAAAAFDTAVCTYTLCSVSDPKQVLRELYRVIRPGGRLLFLEHGQAPDPGIQRWQRRIEPVWRPLLGGCHLTRPISSAVAAAGFAVESMGARYMPGMPRFAGWMEWGVAHRPD